MRKRAEAGDISIERAVVIVILVVLAIWVISKLV